MSGSRSDVVSSVLIVDDEGGIRSFLADVLSESAYDVQQAADGSEALVKLQDRPFDLMFLDLRMPGDLSGMDVLRHARANYPDLQVIVLTAFGTVSMAVEAMRLGAFDFVEKPLRGPDELRRLAARAINWRKSPVVKGQSWLTRPQATEEASPKPTRFARLLWQLKRRHVYNIAATYAAVGFLTLQVAELVTSALPVPHWLYPLLAGLVLGGFPVALLLGWLYDITASGLTRTHSSRHAT
jgi:DNA-binding NtrC family response regulator